MHMIKYEPGQADSQNGADEGANNSLALVPLHDYEAGYADYPAGGLGRDYGDSS